MNTELFWAKVDKSGGDDSCWEWTAALRNGYGVFRAGEGHVPVTAYAHRLSYELAFGRAPDGLVCHTCDNRLCVNPGHFFVGTHYQNSRDMVAKGRGVRGKTHCTKGHEYTPDNLRWRTKGAKIPVRECITCYNARPSVIAR